MRGILAMQSLVTEYNNDSRVTGLVLMLRQPKTELLWTYNAGFGSYKCGAEVACDIFLVRLGQGHLVFFPPATRDQIN